METLINSYGRSLLIYLGIRLIGTKIWSIQDIDRKEKELVKQSMMVPQNIDPNLISNKICNFQPASKEIERLSKRVVM
jgi:hypothetical protein